MARTMSILLGMGLAALALVGCSKNNIAGPQALKPAAAVESDNSADANNWKGRIYLDRRTVPVTESGADYRIEGRLVPAPIEGGWVYVEGRPVHAPIEGGRVYIEGRPMPAPIEGGRVYVDGRPVAAPKRLVVNETDF